MTKDKKTADFKVIPTDSGNCYEFYCDLSGASVCISDPIEGHSPDDELDTAWETFGREHFNKCRKCGKWVIDAMFNPDVLNCVECTPIEEYPKFCTKCGTQTGNVAYFCHICGTRLLYGGGINDEKTEHD